jgi:hypothetical protein
MRDTLRAARELYGLPDDYEPKAHVEIVDVDGEAVRNETEPDDEWREATILTGALWIAGVVERTGPETVAKVRTALRYVRDGRRPDPDPDAHD